MRLSQRFYQLPVLFDVERLQAEVAALPDEAWGPHPDRVHGNSAARLISAGERQGDLELQLQGRLSDVVDVDLSEAALDLTRSQMILELAQAAGARVMQVSLLNFLG